MSYNTDTVWLLFLLVHVIMTIIKQGSKFTIRHRTCPINIFIVPQILECARHFCPGDFSLYSYRISFMSPWKLYCPVNILASRPGHLSFKYFQLWQGVNSWQNLVEYEKLSICYRLDQNLKKRQTALEPIIIC